MRKVRNVRKVRKVRKVQKGKRARRSREQQNLSKIWPHTFGLSDFSGRNSIFGQRPGRRESRKTSTGEKEKKGTGDEENRHGGVGSRRIYLKFVAYFWSLRLFGPKQRYQEILIGVTLGEFGWMVFSKH